jgi:hypothetical protein
MDCGLLLWCHVTVKMVINVLVEGITSILSVLVKGDEFLQNVGYQVQVYTVSHSRNLQFKLKKSTEICKIIHYVISQLWLKVWPSLWHRRILHVSVLCICRMRKSLISKQISVISTTCHNVTVKRKCCWKLQFCCI